MFNDLGQAVLTAAAVTLAGLVVAALWRLGSVLVGLPAALNGIRQITVEHEKRLTHLEALNGVTS